MARKKRDEAEIEAVQKELPLNPPSAVLETIKQRQKAAKLVYRCGYYREPITGLKQKAALVHCTACQESYYLSYAVGGCGQSDSFGFIDPLDNETKCTGKTCVCPECGIGAQAVHISHIGGTYPIEKNYFLTVHNIRGHFVALSWVLFKECDKEGRIIYRLQKYEGIAMIGGMPIRYTGYISGYFGCWIPEWKTRAVWRDNGDEWDIEEIFLNRQDFDSSDASKSGLEEYIIDVRKKIRLGAYLQLWAQDPQIENLVRSGLSSYVRAIIEKATVTSGYYATARSFSVKEAEKYFNKKKVKPHEMLGISKEEIPLVKRWSIERLEFYKELKSRKIKLTEKQLEDVETIGRATFKNLLEDTKEDLGFDPPLIRTLNYLIKQRKPNRKEIDAKYLFDYWTMTKEIQGDLPPALLYPKDLKRAHDQAVLLQKVKVNPEINRKISIYAKTLAWLTFEDEETGLLIRAAESQEELIKEGKFLSHCVGTYAAAVSRRETTILFIRHIDDPEIPFFTLEYRNGTVVQNRGNKNCARTPEVVAFEAKWIQHINEIKGDRKNGKRIRNQVAARQGAGA